MKLYVKFRGSGDVVDTLILEDIDCKIWATSFDNEDYELGIDCDLCDEQGRLLKPEQEHPSVPSVEEIQAMIVEYRNMLGFPNKDSLAIHIHEWLTERAGNQPKPETNELEKIRTSLLYAWGKVVGVMGDENKGMIAIDELRRLVSKYCFEQYSV